MNRRWHIHYRHWLCLLAIGGLVGCSQVETPPATYGGNNAVTAGVLVGGAAGATVGAVTSGGAAIPIGATIGGITGGAIASMATTTTNGPPTKEQLLINKLNQNHIQVIRVGEDHMLVLPSSIYFYPDSSHFNEAMYPAIQDIANYMKLYDIATVKVAGYTNDAGEEARNIGLSRQQAQLVLAELWRDGIRPSFMYSVGYGSTYPIANNSSSSGKETNNRIQITFRRLTPQS